MDSDNIDNIENLGSQLDIFNVIERTCSVLSLVGCIFIIVTFCVSDAFHKPINRLVFYASLYVSPPEHPLNPYLRQERRECWTDTYFVFLQRQHDDKCRNAHGEGLRPIS